MGELSGFVRIFGSAVVFALNRPRTTRNTKETAHSKEVEQLFRLSHRQTLAEAGLELNKGDKKPLMHEHIA